MTIRDFLIDVVKQLTSNPDQRVLLPNGMIYRSLILGTASRILVTSSVKRQMEILGKIHQFVIMFDLPIRFRIVKLGGRTVSVNDVKSRIERKIVHRREGKKDVVKTLQVPRKEKIVGAVRYVMVEMITRD